MSSLRIKFYFVAIITIALLLHYAFPKVLAQQAETDSPTDSNNSNNDTECGGGTISNSEYDFGLHLGALFIILVTSSFGAFIPVLSKRYTALQIPSIAFKVAKNFGTGVILATAFIHMLPSAFANLTNPCLPSLWNTYPAFAGAIAMGSALMIFFIEYLTIKVTEEYEEKFLSEANSPDNATHNNSNINHEVAVDIGEREEKKLESHKSHLPHNHRHMLILDNRTRTVGLVVLEAGICFHSVIIGMTLSVTTGSDFISLLCALIFHQMFEGLGLGSRIAELSFPRESLRPWLMSLAYGITTPFGIAIGLATRYSYNPESQTALIVQGVLDAISAGILLYASMVELLAADFIIDSRIRKSKASDQIFAFSLLILGAVIMALIGRWA